MSFIIGIEVHIELYGRKKLFSNVIKDAVSSFDIAMPGSRPYFNKRYLLSALKLAKILNMAVTPIVYFDRKHYTYYDLPSGYQITQKRYPFASHGSLKNYKISSFHLEGDAAATKNNKVDFTRINRPLIELVTPPIFTNLEDLTDFINELRRILRLNAISEARMDKGNLRVDVNISVDKGKRCEIKNLNSFESIANAVKLYMQDTKLKNTTVPITALYDDTTNTLRVGREKENYLYTNESNIPPIHMRQKNVRIMEDIHILSYILETLSLPDIKAYTKQYKLYGETLLKIQERNFDIWKHPQLNKIVEKVQNKTIPMKDLGCLEAIERHLNTQESAELFNSLVDDLLAKEREKIKNEDPVKYINVLVGKAIANLKQHGVTFVAQDLRAYIVSQVTKIRDEK